MISALKKIKHNKEIQDWDTSDPHVPVTLAHRFFLKWKLPSILPWRDSEEPAKIDVLPLLWQIPFPRVIWLVGQQALLLVLSHFCAPGLGSQFSKRWLMPKLIMSNGPMQVITFPQLFLMGLITWTPNEVYPSHLGTKEVTLIPLADSSL